MYPVLGMCVHVCEAGCRACRWLLLRGVGAFLVQGAADTAGTPFPRWGTALPVIGWRPRGTPLRRVATRLGAAILLLLLLLSTSTSVSLWRRGSRPRVGAVALGTGTRRLLLVPGTRSGPALVTASGPRTGPRPPAVLSLPGLGTGVMRPLLLFPAVPLSVPVP